MKGKILKIYINIFLTFVFFSSNICMGVILNHFNWLNSFSGSVILIINIASFALAEHFDTNLFDKKEEI